jgi:peptide/nickel transport system substrate-binding protein
MAAGRSRWSVVQFRRLAAWKDLETIMAEQKTGIGRLNASVTRRELLERLAALGVAAPAVATLGSAVLPATRAMAQTPVALAKPGGTLRYGFWQPINTLDMQVAGLQIEALINQGIQDRLIWKKVGDPTYYPGLATSWEATPDFTSYTLKLRNDVTFHDGTPFNAQAVKFTFDRIVNPATKSAGALVALGPYDSSDIVDDYTIKVNFKQGNGAFLNMCTTVWLSPQSPTAIQKWGANYQDHLAGAGPFMMTEYVHDDHVTLVKNPNYTWAPEIFSHSGPPLLDTLIFRLLPEDATRLAALKSGDIDLMDRVAPDDLATLAADSAYKTFSGATGGSPWIMALNRDKPPVSELAVRQAMMMAFDQAAVVDLLFKGTLAPSYNYLEPTMIGYTDATKSLYKVDPDGAKALLEQNGWTGDGIREKNGQKLSFDLYIVTNFGMDDMSAVFQSQMQAIGIDVQIKSLESAAWGAAINAGQHGANWTFFWWADPSGPMDGYTSKNVSNGNGSRYANPDFDKLVADALATGDDAKRADLYNQAEALLFKDVAALNAFQKRLVLASTAKVDLGNLHTNAEGYPNFYDVGLLS